VAPARNWVETVVRDDATGQPVPCRVHFRSTEGVPYQPHGHHGHVNSNLGTWHVDVGGDLRLGQISYAYVDGRCQGWLPRGRTIVWATQENRQHLLGHLTLLGLRRPVYPWCSDGPSEAELGGTLETTMAAWADACHAQGGTVILPHLPNPNGEPAALIATGRV